MIPTCNQHAFQRIGHFRFVSFYRGVSFQPQIILDRAIATPLISRNNDHRPVGRKNNNANVG
jgi:hypothetical protein